MTGFSALAGDVKLESYTQARLGRCLFMGLEALLGVSKVSKSKVSLLGGPSQ